MPNTGRTLRGLARIVAAALVCAVMPDGFAAADSLDARIAAVESLRSKLAAGDLQGARTLLAPDARVWYGSRSGEGAPWTPGEGKWKAWDRHFRGVTTPAASWTTGGDSVWADMVESNDYYRLTESGDGRWRATYWFDGAGRISGFLVSSIPGVVSDRGRRDEFQRWAKEHRPAEAEYLMPGGSIDPTGDRPPRMRALLDEWRGTVGLPPLPDGEHRGRRADERLSIRPGSAVRVDGENSPGEWVDADSVLVIAGQRRYVVHFKRDTSALLFGFTGFTGEPIRVPEVLIDTRDRPDGRWSDSTWWFHASATDCWSRGRYNDYSTCVDAAGSWQANNMDDFARPPAIMEIRIPLALVGLDPAGAASVALLLLVTDTDKAVEAWPASARVPDPAGWSVVRIEQPSRGSQ